MNKSTYVLDMKMTREKQRNDLSEELNERINNPATTDTVSYTHLDVYKRQC